jgi:hypothetical protein
MRSLRRRTRLEKIVKASRDAQLPSGVRSALDDIHPPKAVKSAVAAVVAATAASAVISGLRRRIEGTASDR